MKDSPDKNPRLTPIINIATEGLKATAKQAARELGKPVEEIIGRFQGAAIGALEELRHTPEIPIVISLEPTPDPKITLDYARVPKKDLSAAPLNPEEDEWTSTPPILLTRQIDTAPILTYADVIKSAGEDGQDTVVDARVLKIREKSRREDDPDATPDISEGVTPEISVQGSYGHLVAETLPNNTMFAEGRWGKVALDSNHELAQDPNRWNLQNTLVQEEPAFEITPTPDSGDVPTQERQVDQAQVGIELSQEDQTPSMGATAVKFADTPFDPDPENVPNTPAYIIKPRGNQILPRTDGLTLDWSEFNGKK